MIIGNLYKECHFIGNVRGFNLAYATDNALDQVRGLGGPEGIHASFFDTISGKSTHINLTEAQQAKKYFYHIENDAQEVIFTSLDTAEYHFTPNKEERDIMEYFFNIARSNINLYSNYPIGHYNIILYSKKDGQKFIIDNRHYYKPANGNLIN